MGANQSTNGGAEDGAQQKAGAAKTCYYELLGIESHATEEELVLKTAQRNHKAKISYKDQESLPQEGFGTPPRSELWKC